MNKKGTCCRCHRSDRIIVKTIPSEGKICYVCNGVRLSKDKDMPTVSGMMKKSKLMRTDRTSNRMPVKTLIKQLDAVFSVYVRKKFADENGMTKCCTCDTFAHFNTFDLGHCFPRGNFAIRHDERNCNSQCRLCNSTPDGERDKFKLYIDKTYGAGTVEILEDLRNRPHKLDPIKLKEMIKEYSL